LVNGYLIRAGIDNVDNAPIASKTGYAVTLMNISRLAYLVLVIEMKNGATDSDILSKFTKYLKYDVIENSPMGDSHEVYVKKLLAKYATKSQRIERIIKLGKEIANIKKYNSIIKRPN
jgi:hypothetical protein